jgi:phospholipid transport system substrate-binding protein
MMQVRDPDRRRSAAASAARIALLALACTAAAEAAPAPKEFVSETTTQVIAVLKDGSLSSDAKRARVEEIAYSRFDFPTVSRLVLARNWTRLSPEQQTRFIDEFKRHLSVTYGRNLDSYHNETVAIVGEREEARGDYTVKTKIVRGGPSEDILVDYRLRKVGDEWRIIDVTIEGVSLVANFRSQFQDIMASGGPDRLLALLGEKNAKGESILPPGKAHPGGAGEAAAP